MLQELISFFSHNPMYFVTGVGATAALASLVAFFPGGVGIALSWLIRNPRVLVMAATGLAVGFLSLQVKFYQNEVADLREQNSVLQTRIALVETQQKIQSEVTKITDRRIREQEAANKELQAVVDDIQNAPATDDGQLAPVLQREIKRK